MKISELIEKLEELKKLHGDLPVCHDIGDLFDSNVQEIEKARYEPRLGNPGYSASYISGLSESRRIFSPSDETQP